VAVSEEGLVKKRTRRPKPIGNEGAVRKRRGSDNEVGTNIITESTDDIQMTLCMHLQVTVLPVYVVPIFESTDDIQMTLVLSKKHPCIRARQHSNASAKQAHYN
jgi:hypothetical protein